MSARNNKSNSASAKGVKCFCKVCFDAGLTEKEYTNHFVRASPEPNSAVVCPTLLAQECRYCFKSGHTVKFCPILEQQKKAEEKAAKQSARKERKEAFDKPETKTELKPVKKANVFAALDDSSSDNENEVSKPTKLVTFAKSASVVAAKPVPEKRVEEFPALCATKAVAAPMMSGYASIAAKSKEQYDAEKYEQELIEKSIKRQMPPIKKPVAAPVIKKNWADYSSDEEEEEYVMPKASEIDWWAQEPVYDYDSDW